ncbi:hypothetical protein MLD38_007930 [Melastoma candidum]|uniref:Uncharacterized protein n=1 Tax=Melastoma candidum TaxID=119954 RepID=A0ACB9RSN6_9MYRT|nr:hypothetical protein MLD38_007930 [Melastoma candidum]
MASPVSLLLPDIILPSSKRDRKTLDYCDRGRGLWKSSSPLRDCLSLPSSVTRRGMFGLFSSDASLPPAACSAVTGCNEDWTSTAKIDEERIGSHRVDRLVLALHESSRSFYWAIEALGMNASVAELSMAWIGKDARAWLRTLSYQVAIYASLTTVIELEALLSHERNMMPSAVGEILSPRLNLVQEFIESQLSKIRAGLVEWFREVELPRMTTFFIHLLKHWSVEYAGSGIAGIIVAIGCCTAVAKLGPQYSSCPMVALSLEDVVLELMELSHSLVSVEKLHVLATEAGFEARFLRFFGRKVFPSENYEELEFWIGLTQKKLLLAFRSESLMAGIKSSDDEFKAENLAVLGLFAYLGRKTRLYLGNMGIKEVDETLMEFISYLECNVIFIYPEFATLAAYQLFMEIIVDEIGWLDFYATQPTISRQMRKRSRQHAIQAEKEMMLSAVFTICYDVFSGFAHFSRSTLQPLDAETLTFLLRSQSLLAICLEDYWAAYQVKSGEPPRSTETSFHETMSITDSRHASKLYVAFENQRGMSLVDEVSSVRDISQHPSRMIKGAGSNGMKILPVVDGVDAAKANMPRRSLIRKCSGKLASSGLDIYMGTQLLVTDIQVSVDLLSKQFCGQRLTRRERKKIRRTLLDLAYMVPVTILMLLPVSAVGHAAIIAALKKYAPFMIPSPYSSERLDMFKQLKRTKKMQVQLWSSLDDSPAIIT